MWLSRLVSSCGESCRPKNCQAPGPTYPHKQLAAKYLHSAGSPAPQLDNRYSFHSLSSWKPPPETRPVDNFQLVSLLSMSTASYAPSSSEPARCFRRVVPKS